jgi:hypothetical protein
VEQELIIDAANDEVSELLARKFELQRELRLLEVEVGPVKYIAELVYGESNPDLLEEAVRWVILILVVVFDPLALVLVIAGLSIMHRPTKLDNPPEPLHNMPPEPDEEPINTVEEPATQLTMPATLPTSGIKINRTLHDN